MTEEDTIRKAIITLRHGARSLRHSGWNNTARECESVADELELIIRPRSMDDPIDSKERMRRVGEADGLIAGYKAYFGAWVEIARRKIRRHF